LDIERIFSNNRDWVEGKLATDPDYFRRLSEGQSPEILYVGCSDSRVTAEELMGAGPGEVFVHRNIANMVSNLDLNCLSVIQYAVDVLRVKRIVVCGHYYCGGVKSAMQSQDLGILNPWLRNIRDVYRLHRNELNAIESEEERYKRLVELNVEEQCVNVLKTSVVQIAMREHRLTIHGWVFDIHSGSLNDLGINFDEKLEGIREIYHLD
jgi:carbonic anhydrase